MSQYFRMQMLCLYNGKDNLEKFDAKTDENLLLEYSISRNFFILFNKRTLTIKEISNIKPKFVEIEVIDCAGILNNNFSRRQRSR